jgi:hypothetical protein
MERHKLGKSFKASMRLNNSMATKSWIFRIWGLEALRSTICDTLDLNEVRLSQV